MNMQEIMNNILAATAIVAVFAMIAVEAIKRTGKVPAHVLPLLSVTVGMLAGVLVALGFGQDLPTYIAAGFIAGAAASGIYDLGSKTIKGE